MKTRGIIAVAATATFALAGCAQEPPVTTGDSAAPSNDAVVECATDNEVSIYLARHGKTMLNTVDRSQGWIDAPLTPAGIEVAEALGRGTADVSFDAVYSSSSGRAIETAVLVLENNGQADLIDSLVQDPRLREYNFGTFEGMPNEEMISEAAAGLEQSAEEILAGNYVDAIQALADQLAQMDAAALEPGVNWPAENYETVAERAMEALDSIAADAQEQCLSSVLVVSHGMTISTIAAELGAKDAVPPGGPANSSVTLITHANDEYTVHSVGDTSYLEAGQTEG